MSTQLSFTAEEKLLFKIVKNDVTFYPTLGSVVTCNRIYCIRRKCLILQSDSFGLLFLFSKTHQTVYYSRRRAGHNGSKIKIAQIGFEQEKTYIHSRRDYRKCAFCQGFIGLKVAFLQKYLDFYGIIVNLKLSAEVCVNNIVGFSLCINRDILSSNFQAIRFYNHKYYSHLVLNLKNINKTIKSTRL